MLRNRVVRLQVDKQDRQTLQRLHYNVATISRINRSTLINRLGIVENLDPEKSIDSESQKS